MFCTGCGKELNPDDEFCNNCGRPVKPVRPEEAPSVVQPPAVPPAGRRRSKRLMIMGAAAALLLAAAVVLVLVFVVFPGGGGPEGVVRQFLEAVEGEDIPAMIALVDPEPFKKEKGSRKAFEEFIAKTGPARRGTEFEGIALESVEKGDEATVKATGGSVSYKDEEGKRVTEDLVEFLGETRLVKRDGSWYISLEMFPEFWGGYYAAQADKITAELESNTRDELADIDELFSSLGQGVTSLQELDDQFKTKSAETAGGIEKLRKDARLARAGYRHVLELEEAGRYGEYAELRIKQIEGAVKVIDLLSDFLDRLGAYISNIAANPPSSVEAVEQGLNELLANFTADMGEVQAEYGPVDEEVERLKKELDL